MAVGGDLARQWVLLCLWRGNVRILSDPEVVVLLARHSVQLLDEALRCVGVGELALFVVVSLWTYVLRSCLVLWWAAIGNVGGEAAHLWIRQLLRKLLAAFVVELLSRRAQQLLDVLVVHLDRGLRSLDLILDGFVICAHQVEDALLTLAITPQFGKLLL